MIVNDFLRWFESFKTYLPSYSEMVSTIALILSILSFSVSKRQYEERLSEERQCRKDDKHYMEERIRISEQPYLVFKDVKIIQDSAHEQTIISTEFLNKGRGSAYNIIPDTECRAITFDMKEIQLHRQTNVQDHIAMVGETFVVNWSFICGEDNRIRIYPAIKFSDASGRIYKQTYHIDVVDSKGNANVISWGSPELLK